MVKVGDNFKDTLEPISMEERHNWTLSEKINETTLGTQNNCSRLLLKKVLNQKERKVRR